MDETKSNLDGHDHLEMYSHDIRREKQIFFTRNETDGSFMVWRARSYCLFSILVIVSVNMKSIAYYEVLDENLLLLAAVRHGKNWTFQEENVFCYCFTYIKNRMTSKQVKILNWPAHSPVLNTIENVNGEMET